MSVAISIENVIKRFRKDTIINGLPLDVRPDEFFTLLGPSRCDKITLLCMIIGFNSIEGGEIKIDGRVISDVLTNKRDIGMMSQGYAIFPHMSVRDSIAFGPKNRRAPQDQIESQVDEILRVIKINHLKKRMPSKLSGGQQQRVTLTRAIVVHPEVLLMDEPLSNLGTKLRVEMRNAIKRIQQQMGITTICVTRNQEEALTASDRIAVMNGGIIQQTNTPRNIYQWPSNISVSTFIGLSNIMDGRIKAKDGRAFLYIGDYSVPMENLSHNADDDQAMRMSIWPREFITDREGSDGIPAVVQSSVFLSITTHYLVETADGKEMEVI